MGKNLVLVISIVLCGALGVWGVVEPDQMTGSAMALTGFALKSLDWFFLVLCTFFLFLIAYLAFGPYGHIRLGKDDEQPEFSTVSWIAMLFAGGMGSGLLFWGVAEPIYHFYSPPGEAGQTAEAARTAFVITNFHWGLHAWSIYGVCALVIAYFVFRKDAPSMVSTPIRLAFGNMMGARTLNTLCVTSDVVAVLAVIFGLAGSLAMGTLLVRTGMAEVFGTSPDSNTVSLVILAVLTVMFLLSASTGVDKGIKILSNINMAIAVIIMLVVLFAGPTVFILGTFINSIGDYFSRLVSMSFKLFTFNEELGSWTHGWTLTYLIWWIAWGPFVGIFIARISRGRTIREFSLGVVLIPTIFSMLWFATFGGAAINIELLGGGGLAEIVFEDVTKALFAFFSYLPLTQLLNVLAIFLIFIFLVTSADSGTFVVSMMTTNGNLNPDTKTKLTWGIIMSAITVGVLVSGSVTVAKAMAITGAVPFTFIVIVQIVAFLRTIKHDEAVQPKARAATGAAMAGTSE